MRLSENTLSHSLHIEGPLLNIGPPMDLNRTVISEGLPMRHNSGARKRERNHTQFACVQQQRLDMKVCRELYEYVLPVESVHGSGELASSPGRILDRETANRQHHRRDSELERVPPKKST
jgi:hypothetical protein